MGPGPASLRRDPPSSGRCCRRAGTPSSFACGRSASRPSRGGPPRGPRRPCRRGPASWCRSRLLWKQLPSVHSRSKGCQKDNRSIRPAVFKNCCFYLETEIKRNSGRPRALASGCGATTEWIGAGRNGLTRSHPEVSQPDRDDDDHDDHDGDSDVEEHLPLSFLLAAETQTRDIVGHVGPRPPKLPSRNKDFVIRKTTAPHSTGAAAPVRRAEAERRMQSSLSEARRSRRSHTP